MHLQIEKTFFELAKGEGRNCLVLCDRGIMDLSACKYYPHHVISHIVCAWKMSQLILVHFHEEL